MIPIMPAPEPDAFDSTVRQPGLVSIAEKIGEKPNPPRENGPAFKRLVGIHTRDKIPPNQFKDYWREAIPDMMTAYKQICAYSCFRIHRITGAVSVDHMAPKSRRWDRVYEWSNYRLASSRMNARKNNFEDIIDPFEIQDGWFQLENFGFGIHANPNLQQQDLIGRINETINRLNLNDEYHRTQRELDIEEYLIGKERSPVPLWKLEQESPFVALELRRQGRLRVGDQ